MGRKIQRLPQTNIRLPIPLRQKLEREAAKNGRTLNAEIVYRLSQPFVEADARRAGREGAMEVATEAASAAAAAVVEKVLWRIEGAYKGAPASIERVEFSKEEKPK